MQRCKGYEQFSKRAIKLQAQVATTPRGLLFLIFNKTTLSVYKHIPFYTSLVFAIAQK